MSIIVALKWHQFRDVSTRVTYKDILERRLPLDLEMIEILKRLKIVKYLTNNKTPFLQIDDFCQKFCYRLVDSLDL